MKRAMLGVALVVAGAGCGPWPPIVLDPLGFRGSEPSGPSVSPPPTTVAQSSEGVGPIPPAIASTPSDHLAETLACIRELESGGDYTIDTGNGYYGAFQFLPSTWSGAVSRAGHPEWSERPASEAPPAVQDAAAAQLLSEQGLAPWPLPAERCS